MEIPDTHPTPPGQQATKPQDSEAPPVLAFDVEAVLDMLDQNQELAKVVVQSAIDDLSQQITDLAQSIDAGDWATAKRTAHTMKGLSAQVGAMALHQKVIQVHLRLRDGAEIAIDEIADLRDRYDNFSTGAVAWLGSAGAATDC